MDDLLKAYARQRRQQGEPPLELHAASRKLLQDEVRRSLGRAAPPAQRPSLWQWLGARWPRLALGGGLVAALIVLSVMMAPEPSSLTSHTAGRSPLAAPTTPNEVAAVPAATPPPPSAPAMPARPADNLSMPGPAPSPLPAIAAANTSALSGQPSSTAINTVASAPPPAAAPVPQPAAVGGETPASQEFVQISNSARNFKKGEPAPTEVLSVFQMERRGQNVIIRDSDGSIYNGEVLEPPAIAGREGFGKDGGGAVPAEAKLWSGEDASANYSFKVIGVNNRLQQNIVFTGNVRQAVEQTARAGALRSPRAAAGAPAGQSVAVENSLAQPPVAAGLALSNQSSSNQAAQNRLTQKQLLQNQALQNLRVTGKVRVDGGGEFDIEAAPPGP